MPIETQLEEIQKKANELTNRVATEGVTDESGRVLVAPTVNDVKDTIGFPESFQSEAPQSAIQSLATTKATADSIVLAQQEQLDNYLKQQEQLNKTLGLKDGETVMGKLAQMQEGVGSSDLGAVRTQAQQQQNIPQLSDQVKQQSLKVASLSGDIDKLDVRRLAEIDRAYAQQGVPMRFIQGQVGEIDRKFNIEKAYKSAELGAQSALLQAQTGNLQLANNMVSDIVNAYTFDIQQQRKDVSDLINVYGDWFTSLEKDQQSILTDLATRLEKQETETKNEKTQIMNWMIEYPSAGITLNDTLDGAADKATNWKATNPETSILSVSEAATLGLPYGTTKEQAQVMGIIPAKSGGTQVGSAQAVYEQLKTATNDLKLGGNAISSKIRGLALTAGAASQSNTDAAAYSALVNGSVSLLIRGLGERGVLTDNDIARAKSLIPSFFDTQATADKKLEQLNSLLTAAENKTSSTGSVSKEITKPDGTVWRENPDGTYTRIK
jgi:hypothetical protein